MQMRIHLCFKPRELQVEKKQDGLFQLGGLVPEQELVLHHSSGCASVGFSVTEDWYCNSAGLEDQRFGEDRKDWRRMEGRLWAGRAF